MLLKDLFDIDSFQSFFEKGGWFSINENLQSVLNAMLNIAFGLIKYLVLALDYVIDKLFSLPLCFSFRDVHSIPLVKCIIICVHHNSLTQIISRS